MMALCNCPRCGRQATEAGAVFCPFCGERLTADRSGEIPAGAAALLQKASEQSSNRRKLALLRQARQEYPDCLAVEEEWLFQGKLPESPGLMLDFAGIKCWLLQPYLTPEAFDESRRRAMADELFGDPQLLRCMALSGAEEAYTARYLERLCREFIDVFLKGSSEYMPRLLGIPLERNPAKALAKPGAKMLRAMQTDENLTAIQRDSLCAAFRQAFSAECGGDLRWLRQAMGE